MYIDEDKSVSTAPTDSDGQSASASLLPFPVKAIYPATALLIPLPVHPPIAKLPHSLNGDIRGSDKVSDQDDSGAQRNTAGCAEYKIYEISEESRVVTERQERARQALAACCGLDSLTRLWDLCTNRSVLALEGHVKPAYAMGLEAETAKPKEENEEVTQKQATMMVIDNSRWMGDSHSLNKTFLADCVNLISGAKLQCNQENVLGVLTLAGTWKHILLRPTSDFRRLLRHIQGYVTRDAPGYLHRGKF